MTTIIHLSEESALRLPRPATRLAATLGLLCGLVTSVTGISSVTAATSAAAANGVPRPDHVVVVLFENTAEGSIIGNSQAPYFNQLASTGANFTNAFAIEHPSEPNYLDLFSGSNQGVTDDSCPHTFSADNEGAQLIAKGLTFTGYSEDLPSAGSTVCTSGKYARKHNPWVNFSNVPAADNQPFSAFPTDFTQLPTVSWVIPNLCNDIHDCSIATGDNWLKTHLDSYVQWAKAHNSVLITTFDEDDSAGDNQIATLINGQPVKTGSYSERIDHFSVLRTIEDMYGLPYAGAAAQATSITDAWSTGGPTGSVTVTNPGAQTGTVGTAASLQLNATDTATGTLSWSATGLPAGLSINASNGLISGTPTTAGTFNAAVTATDSTGPAGSASFSWTIAPAGGGGCTAAQLLGNPGFETGSAAPWTASSGVIDNSSSEAAHSGSWKAWLDGYGSSHTDTLSQKVTIPAGCRASLSFWLHIDTAESGSTVYDTLKLAANSSPLATWSNVNAATGFVQKTFDLSSFAGQTVTLTFTGTEDSSQQTSFVIDDTALNVS
ncbi:alkaline phosphatase family protein [Kitasatospora azatica]|uniref:alkaline phosphatase family protein n=1 Tax=Kitasatospora azatica TaxID=58347 RepID=UPI0007C7F054|nr:alkaline phosphatase family protein [Kitasatospora azatica]